MNEQSAPKVKFPRLWRLAEQMDWDERFPRWFWRWLLRTLDRANGHRFEYLEADDV